MYENTKEELENKLEEVMEIIDNLSAERTYWKETAEQYKEERDIITEAYENLKESIFSEPNKDE
jgi:hypothetical protein